MTMQNPRDRRIQAIRAAFSPSFASLREGQRSIEDALQRRGEEISSAKAAVSDLKDALNVTAKANAGCHDASPL